MPKVIVLADHIASQIAAGEVVERPSSVVKELVENAVDAGATRVEIAVSADMRDIRIADDGCGMEAEDAVLAFHRHATSKLKSVDDLWRLQSLGFRGEALPSIASVAKVACLTRTRNSSTGHKIEARDGQVSASETGCSPGTVMEITDLFYNVPARLSFLKKASTEFGHVQEIVQALAISYLNVAFHLINDGETTFKTSGQGDLAQAIKETRLFSGKTNRNELCEVKFQDGEVEISGLLARPIHFRGDRKGILTIVNGRPVRCPLTLKALDYAYSDLIPRGRYPLAVVKLNVDPSTIDINIHPTKKEIKYSTGNEVYLVVQRALLKALREVRSPHLQAEPQQIDFAPQSLEGPLLPLPAYREAGAPAGTTAFGAGEGERGEPMAVTMVAEGRERQSRDLNFREEGGADLGQGLAVRESESRRTAASQLGFHERLAYRPYEANRVDETAKPSASAYELPAGWRIAGYLHNTYILVETPDGLEVIEQHIAHERTLYERLLAQQTTTGRISDYSQQLLISQPLDLTAEQRSVLSPNLPVLQKLGFDFEIDGEQVTCSQVPLELAHKDYAAAIQDLLAQIATADSANLELEATKSIACQSAIKNGMPQSPNDLIKLIAEWHATPRNDTCPHGRPVKLSFPMDKLFQLFHPA